MGKGRQGWRRETKERVLIFRYPRGVAGVPPGPRERKRL